MKYLILLISLLAFTNLLAQDSERIYLNSSLIEVMEVDRAFYKEYEESENSFKELIYHLNGNLFCSTEFKNKKFEVKNGHFFRFHENMEIAEEGVYKNNLKIGDWFTWYDNKQLMVKERFSKKGEILPQEYIKYNYDGSINTKGQYSEKGMEGEWLWYHKNGVIAAKEVYLKGKLINWEYTNEDGKKFYNRKKANYIPRYPGGKLALNAFLRKHLEYPAEAIKDKIQGTVYVEFNIEKDGKVSNIHISEGLNKYLDKEALRLINIMRPWKPGKENNRYTAVGIIMPICFGIEQQQAPFLLGRSRNGSYNSPRY